MSRYFLHRDSAVLVEDLDNVGTVQGSCRRHNAPHDCFAVLENASGGRNEDDGRGHIARLWSTNLDGCAGRNRISKRSC